MTEPNDETLRSWLLGRLSPHDAEALEQRLVEDETFAERLRGVENDLLDDFARDRLIGDERAWAVMYFAATPNDRARLRIARALASVAGGAARPRAHLSRRTAASARPVMHALRRRRALMTGLFASACAVAIAVVGLSSRRSATSDTDALTITLMDSQQRGAQSMSIAIPSATSNLRIQAEVDSAATESRYTLRIEDGDTTAFSADDLEPRAAGPYRFVEVTLPASKLASGRHRVRVSASDAPESGSTWMLTTRIEAAPTAH